MQLIPRYLVDERIKVLSNDSGFVVEYRPVYSRTLKIYRGIDNVIQFRLLNADQKPVSIDDEYYFVVFDENHNKLIERLTTVTDDSTSATRGMFEVTVTENDLLNVRQQYLHYNIYKRANGVNTVTYASRDFESAGIIYLDGHAYPGAKYSTEITNFYQNGDVWVAGNDTNNEIGADPGINGNEALHTVAVYSNGYIGNVEVQATLDNQINGSNNWATVGTLVFDGSSETQPVPFNFNGVFSFLRFKFDADPTSTITKILIRN
jgi:hypothetical protein